MNVHQPLAEQLRPTCIDEVIGQKHLLGPGMPLSLAFANKKPHSMLFWGPPGVGKTTLARLTAQAFEGEWIALSAVFAGVKDIRAAINEAEGYRALGLAVIVFIDEIHRFNKAQQDALLPHIESGLITCIGATTENPAFEINAALLSRMQLYILKPLLPEELALLLLRAQKYACPELIWAPLANEVMVSYADGDARRLVQLVEQVQQAAASLSVDVIQAEWLQTTITRNVRRFDKHGDCFYDQISALHKSVRGSNPDAALYWLCRLLDGGMDPHYIARRLIRIAWEDIGLADPRAMQIATDAASTYDRLGSPEGELALAEATLYLSIAAKSNAGYLAYKKARNYVKSESSQAVPQHLRNSPLKSEVNSRPYRYPHDEPHAFAAGETYLPENMQQPHWYQPVDRGLERKIREKIAFLQKL